MAKMTLKMWNGVEHFSPEEKWGDPLEMDSRIIFELNALRQYVDKPITIHCGYEQRATGGQHTFGRAVDFHIVGMHVIDQFLVASRFDGFNGIGIYPNWNSPGLHCDSRSKSQNYFADARWISPAPGVYKALDKDHICRYCL